MKGNARQQKTWGQSFPLCGRGSYTPLLVLAQNQQLSQLLLQAAATLSPLFQSRRHLATMANMTFEDVDVEAVAELSAEEVEEREVFEQEEKEEVEGVLDFFLGGGQSRVNQQLV